MSPSEQRWENAAEAERRSVLTAYGGFPDSQAEAYSVVSWASLPAKAKKVWEKWLKRG